MVLKWFYSWFGEPYSATEKSFGRGGKHWTEYEIFLRGYYGIWNLNTDLLPFRYWPKFISKRLRYSYPFKYFL